MTWSCVVVLSMGGVVYLAGVVVLARYLLRLRDRAARRAKGAQP